MELQVLTLDHGLPRETVMMHPWGCKGAASAAAFYGEIPPSLYLNFSSLVLP
jgi:hypothetical protein